MTRGEPGAMTVADPRPRWRNRATSLASDLLAPVLLSGAAAHELVYNRSGVSSWVLVLAIIWPLAIRRRAPTVVFVVTLVLALVCWASDTLTVANLAVLVALYSVAAHRDRRYAACAAVAVEVGVVLIAVRFGPTGSVNDAIILLTALAAAALLLGTTMRSQRQYLASVEDRARQLERDRWQQAQLAAAAERTRIAREMHDIVAHGLSVVITLAQGAAIAAEHSPQTAARAMEQAADAGRQSLHEMRRLLQVLRDDAPAEKGPQPDLAALDRLVRDVGRTGLDVRLVTRGDATSLGTTTQATIYRIAQEALTNVLKHADNPSTVTITLDVTVDAVHFAVENDDRAGRAGGAIEAGNGVTGMRERVALFGGTVDSGPSPTGWRVHGHLPVG